jgi:hypothetical protein
MNVLSSVEQNVVSTLVSEGVPMGRAISVVSGVERANAKRFDELLRTARVIAGLGLDHE